MESAWSEHGVMVYEALYLGGASDRVRWHQGSVPAGAGRHEAEIRFASWSVTCSDWRANSRTEVRRRARLFVTNFVGAFVRCWSLASRRTRVLISGNGSVMEGRAASPLHAAAHPARRFGAQRAARPTSSRDD
jgi:hypothetical protein